MQANIILTKTVKAYLEYVPSMKENVDGIHIHDDVTNIIERGKLYVNDVTILHNEMVLKRMPLILLNLSPPVYK